MKRNNVIDSVIDNLNISDDHVVNLLGEPLPTSILLALKLFKENKENVLLLTQNNHIANKTYKSLATLVGDENLILIPSDELIRVEYISQSKELLAQQIMSIYDLINCKHKIIISPTQSTYRYYPSKELFLSNIFELKVGQEIDLQELKNKLVKMGYYQVNKIDQSLQFASRGDILDIYSLNYENPIRLEFFGDEIESIRFFTIENQKSIDKVNDVSILPATLNLLDENEVKNAENKIREQAEKDIKKAASMDFQMALEAAISEDLELIKTSNFSSKFYKYMGYLQGIHHELTDFFDNYSIIHSDKTTSEAQFKKVIIESKQFLDELSQVGKCISGLTYFNENTDLDKNANKVFFIDTLDFKENLTRTFITEPFFISNKQTTSSNVFVSYKAGKTKVICTLADPIYYKKTIALLNELPIIKYIEKDDLNFDIDTIDADVILIKSSIDFAFELTSKNFVILTEKELYGIKRHKSTYKNVFKEGSIINGYEELTPGDFVVHENYGIGEYVGITTLNIDNIHSDYMEVHYSGEEKLYVPLYQFNLIRKYVGREGTRPRLSRLSTNQWEKTKKKIKERVNELADRLLLLYQERSKIEGFEFEKDEDLQKEFENEFEYELTYDQQRAVNEIKADMESSIPMDRLLCGDVGFGKTEVAFRAAFKALMNGKQVALLCPTTLLARQHYELAKERFKNFNVGLGILTRLQKESDNKLTMESIASGRINFVIGTHKILSKSLHFKDLGLLIIDEEQRFGVEQKEKIKEKSKNIDVLTLSATPIPRTLQSTLVGLKTTSTITTPPKERMPIQTYVIPFDDSVVKELINRELDRNGQVFYVHNEIKTIYERAATIQDLIPTATVGIIHAKMDKNEIEDVMNEFYNGEIDILVATSIIENGIDVRNANLILVDNADHFGLAQLYQIKGRVGRGDRMAFAYLLVDGQKDLNRDAQKRIKAIQDFTELGSGYKIAQRDLLIRGAGDILGPEQAGFIDAIGIDMYIRILNQTIKDKKNPALKVNPAKVSNLRMDGYIPSTFVNDENKLEIYQRIIDCETIEYLDITRKDIIDIYGKIPEEVEILFIKKKIDLYLKNSEVFEELAEFPNFVKLILTSDFSTIEGIGTQLFTSLINIIRDVTIKFIDNKLIVIIDKRKDYINLLITVMQVVLDLYNINMKVDKVDENR